MGRLRARSRLGVALELGALIWTACWMQAQTQANGRAQVMVSSGGLLAEGSSTQPRGELYREIDDPHTGDRWLLLRNEEFPGGPGRLVRVRAGQSAASGADEPIGVPRQLDQPAGQAAQLLPVIRSGDRVVVEEHTAVVDVVLEARALAPAAAGAVFVARLAIGGRVVRVVALGPGRAAFQPEKEARP